MLYQEYKPDKMLESYIKCYYVLEYGHDSMVEDQAFATGCIELMFTLEGNTWQPKRNNTFSNTSPVELWGQVLQPLTFRTSGYNLVFGVRFYPATAAFFLKEDISHFNDTVVDLSSVVGNTVTELHARLQEAPSTAQRIRLADDFFSKKLTESPKLITKINLVQQVMAELSHKDFFDNIEHVATRYGITSRYLQKIFLRHTGLTPKLYTKINRFQNSLVLMGQSQHTLTSVAYASGYFDQSHFIREFRSFTGFAPSAFEPSSSTAILASPNK